jgi:hypothetical protein
MRRSPGRVLLAEAAPTQLDEHASSSQAKPFVQPQWV